jgi:hypothetical protein
MHVESTVEPQVPPLRYAPVGGCDFFDFFQGLVAGKL